MPGVVVFSYAQDSLKLAAIMSVILKKLSPQLVCHLKSASHSRHRREHLDTADVIIYFVSDQFVSTQSLAEELHTGLCRQRTVKDSTIVYFIQVRTCGCWVGMLIAWTHTHPYPITTVR